MRNPKRIGAACLTALGLVFVGLAGVNAAAADAEKAPWDLTAQEKGTKKGSIKILKKKDGDTAKAVAGAEFTVTPVTKIDGADFDLTNRADWSKVAKKVTVLNAHTEKLTAEGGKPADIALGTPQKQTTTAQGVAEFKNLAIGLYKVEETKVPQGYDSDIVPFYVTIPQITGKDAAAATYKYNVEVTPKNKDITSDISKTQDLTATVGEGDNITYTIEAGVNKRNTSGDQAKNIKAADIQGYSIFDDIQTAVYDAVNETNKDGVVAEITMGQIKIENASGKAPEYEVNLVNYDANDPVKKTIGADRQRILIKFTEAGLTKIVNGVNKAQPDKIKVKLTLKLKSGNKVKIQNKYGFIPGKGTNEPQKPPVIPNTSTDLDVQEFQIKKIDPNGDQVLQHAKFKLFATEAAAKTCAANHTQCTGNSAGFGERETGADGLTLKYIAKTGDKFWVVETQAPSNDYTPYNHPIEVKVEKTDAEHMHNGVFILTVENIAKADVDGKWFNLPKTGAAGIFIFAVLGVVFVGAGTVMALRRRNGREEEK